MVDDYRGSLACFLCLYFVMGYLSLSNMHVNLAVEIFLGATTWIIIGEAYHINDRYKNISVNGLKNKGGML